jgi:hypothetical protein
LLDATNSIEILKAKVQYKEGIPSDQKCLILGGKLLKDEKS